MAHGTLTARPLAPAGIAAATLFSVALAALVAARVPMAATMVALVVLAAVMAVELCRCGSATITVVYQHKSARLCIRRAGRERFTEIDRSRWFFRLGVCLYGRDEKGRRQRLVLARPAVSAASLRRLRLWDLARPSR